MSKTRARLLIFAATMLLLGVSEGFQSRTSSGWGGGSGYKDPGVRTGDAGAGGFLADLTIQEQKFFQAGLEDFEEAEGVGDGLGPRFNLDSCGGCHI